MKLGQTTRKPATKSTDDLLVELQNAVSNPNDFRDEDTYNYMQGVVEQFIDALDTPEPIVTATYPVISFYGDDDFSAEMTAEQIGNFVLDMDGKTTITRYNINGEDLIVTRTEDK